MTRAAIPRPPIPRLAGETLRYGMAMVVGLGVDLGLGYALNRWLAVPMLAAAAVGFLIAVAVNYLQFEYWVFATRQPGWARLGRAYGAAQGALLVRLAMVWLLGRLGLGRLAILAGAAGLSFVVNFLLARRWLGTRDGGDAA